MITNNLSKLLLYFTKEDVEFTLDCVITDAEWDAFLTTFDVIPTETRDRARAILAAEFQAFIQQHDLSGNVIEPQRPMLGLSGRL
jgi:hypothetical protein